MPFVPTPIAGALSAINNTRLNQKKTSEQPASPELKEQPVRRRSAFKELFFGPGK